ncbi:MAG: hypothetical protein JNM24_00485 [Bdellovibrionaceae bacterium]|nr:hypothetical protein [Pseudobdellovibrionaceae bacterium]
MKSRIKTITAGMIALGGVTAMGAESAQKVSLPSMLVGYMTQNYPDAKINSLLVNHIFEIDQANSRVLVDIEKLKQLATSTQDQELLQLASQVQDLAANETFVQVVNPNDMVVGSQDRMGPQ